MKTTDPWAFKVRVAASSTGPAVYDLSAGETDRAAVARLLNLADLPSLTARATVTPWFDGVQIDASWRADVVQTCGLTLEPLESALEGAFTVRVVPPSSPHAPDLEAELVIDLEADDPPDVSEDNDIDLAHYVVEHLALEIDPFPRKPGAEFVAPDTSAEISPFAVLRRLKGDGEA